MGVAYGAPMIISEGDLQMKIASMHNMIDTLLSDKETGGKQHLIEIARRAVNGRQL